MNRLLHLGIGILNTQRSSIDAEIRQHLDLFRRNDARIDLDTAFRIRREAECAAQHLAQLAERIRREEGRRAAPKVELFHRTIQIDPGSD